MGQQQDGGAGASPTSGDDKERTQLSSVYIQGPTLGIAYARGSWGEGALASGNMVSPALACPWPVARSTLGLWGARGWGRLMPAPR